jgi:hypothetical protein
MTKTKLKERSGVDVRRRTRSQHPQQTPEFISIVRDVWQQEVAQLESRQFSSLKEVVEHFVNIVVAKMGDVPDIVMRREFLVELLLQDEILCRELMDLFPISKKES